MNSTSLKVRRYKAEYTKNICRYSSVLTQQRRFFRVRNSSSIIYLTYVTIFYTFAQPIASSAYMRCSSKLTYIVIVRTSESSSLSITKSHSNRLSRLIPCWLIHEHRTIISSGQHSRRWHWERQDGEANYLVSVHRERLIACPSVARGRSKPI